MKRQFLLLIAVFFLFTPWASVNVYADIFFDDFDDGNADGWWLGYSHHTPWVDRNWSVEDGTLVQGGGGDHFIGLVEDLVLSDQVIETQVNTLGYGGVTLWYHDDRNLINVAIYPFSAGIYVREVIDGAGPRLHYNYRTSHDTWYDLRVEADSLSGELAIYLDDFYVFTYYVNTPYRTGLSGVHSGNGGARFDNFSIVPLPSAVLLGMLGLSVAGVKLRKHNKL